MAKLSVFSIYFLAFILVVTTVSIVYSGWFKPLSEFFQTCWLGDGPHNLKEWIQQLRGNNYWVEPKDSGTRRRYCLITSWSVSHILLYAIIGYCFPSLFWQTLLIGVGYEIMEWMTLDCHDVLDIAWNSLGFVIGMTIRGILKR